MPLVETTTATRTRVKSPIITATAAAIVPGRTTATRRAGSTMIAVDARIGRPTLVGVSVLGGSPYRLLTSCWTCRIVARYQDHRQSATPSTAASAVVPTTATRRTVASLSLTSRAGRYRIAASAR